MQLQRGLKVYTEVCSACHGLRYVPFRTLADEGGPHLPDDQMRAYSAFYEVFDPDLDDFRPAKPTDNFPVSGDPNAPDLSLMAKARARVPRTLRAGHQPVLQGDGRARIHHRDPDRLYRRGKEEAGTTLYENTAFPGGWISMAPPLFDEAVEFDDGHANDIDHIAEDVAAFLMWTAEPHMNARKEAGFVSVLFLIIVSVLLYLTNKRIWAKVKHRRNDDA